MKTKSFKSYLEKRLRNKSFARAYGEEGCLMRIAIDIVNARNKAGLSQAQLASRLKTTQSVISRIENGNQNVSITMLSKIAKILNCCLTVDLKPSKKAA